MGDDVRARVLDIAHPVPVHEVGADKDVVMANTVAGRDAAAEAPDPCAIAAIIGWIAPAGSGVEDSVITACVGPACPGGAMSITN